MLYSPGESAMSSAQPLLTTAALSIALHLVAIFVIALLLNRLSRELTNLLVKTAAGHSRVEQQREQQTRTLAGVAYRVISKVVWAIAILTALDTVGISPVPALTAAGLAGVAVGFGAQNLVRDVIGGFYIVLEDQYTVGDTVQIADIVGRVEQLTLRRTVLRDARGALVTVANGEIRTVANLGRDWSQSFLDVSLAPETALEKPLATLETVFSTLRNDPSWAQALLDGPHVLGVQSYDRNAAVIRVQVRTVPLRQDEVVRELRRRIQIEFQKEAMPLASVVKLELVNRPEQADDGQPATHS